MDLALTNKIKEFTKSWLRDKGLSLDQRTLTLKPEYLLEVIEYVTSNVAAQKDTLHILGVTFQWKRIVSVKFDINKCEVTVLVKYSTTQIGLTSRDFAFMQAYVKSCLDERANSSKQFSYTVDQVYEGTIYNFNHDE